MAIRAVDVPTSEPPADAAPKRGRGRPRKDGSDTAPRTRQPRQPAVTEEAVGGLLFMFNMPLSMVPFLQADALDEIEMQAMAKGIMEQCKASPAFKRYVQMALKMSGATGLLAPLSIIIARRGVRHGIIPGGGNADVQMGQLIGIMAGRISPTSFVPTFSSGDVATDLDTLSGMNDDTLHPPAATPFPVQPVFSEPVD